MRAVCRAVSRAVCTTRPCPYPTPTPSPSTPSGCTLPPPGWCFMLSVEPILERAGAVLGRGAMPAVELGRGARGTGGFLSGPAAVEAAGTAGLGAGRARLVGPEGLEAVELRGRLGLGRAESTGGEEDRKSVV